MNGKAPHLVQYQGSKRKLAPFILQYMPSKFNRLIEPFAGMAAITIAVAQQSRTSSFHINDLNYPLIKLLEQVINEPLLVSKNYERVWKEQFTQNHIEHFYFIRDLFNSGKREPENMLYLLARCVKGAVRYGKDGKFNQSPDKRRHGTTPENILKNAILISNLLLGKTTFSSLDYREVFEMARPGDIVYMDPPYQGVTNVPDNRYFSGVPFDEFSKSIEVLNRKNVDFLISYDGECGGKEYGHDLPKELGCTKILLNAGLSSQAILLGRKNITYESLYVSKHLSYIIQDIPKQIVFMEEAYE